MVGGRSCARGLFFILSPQKKPAFQPSVATVSCNHLLRPSAATTIGATTSCKQQLQPQAATIGATINCKQHLQPAAAATTRCDHWYNHQLQPPDATIAATTPAATICATTSCNYYLPPAFIRNDAMNYSRGSLSAAAFT